MSFAYTRFTQDLGRGLVNLQEAGADIRVILVMSNTTADTERDVATISAFATLDEYDGANYVRKALALQTFDEDQPNDRSEFDASDIQWAALGVGTRQAVGMIVFRFVTNDTDSVPICYIDTGGFPFDGNGGNIDVAWNAQGILQVTAP